MSALLGLPDNKWGEIVVALYVSKGNHLSAEEIKTALKISQYKIPKYWLEVETIPRCDRGKINYQQIREIASQQKRSLS